jgi:hypothetical protein
MHLKLAIAPGEPSLQQILKSTEPLRECIAELIAEGSMRDPLGSKVYHLTNAGYEKYKSRIHAQRALPR